MLDQRPLLGVGALARNDVGDQHQGQVEDDQTLSGQGAGGVPPGDVQSPLGGGQVVAIEDPHTVARQQALARPTQLGDQRLAPARHVRDHGSRNTRLDVADFVVHALEGNGNPLAEVLVCGMDMESLAADDQAHRVDGGGEQQFPGVAAFGGPVEQVIEGRGRECMFDRGPRHHTQRTGLEKALEYPTEEHGCVLTQDLPSPCLVAPYRQATSP
ncbi:hypothetical protein R5W24_006290 [Gemmata sp. JC717]|uniref:hypothetical protein n=1 Tax=Gemmata algarum TaxID=2975278 RepID=UPI0021BA850F|nr:hypothetical protein [Gemmata algarum]MDY3557103.1 hypothetical protein [Gemmata algarum]